MNSRQIRAAAEEALSVTVRETLLLAHDNVTNATPVDTGHAASNWLLSTGRPVYSVAGSREAVDWSEWRAGRALIANYHVRMGRIYLRNNVIYIRALNRGHSQQAVAGFVEMALAGAARKMPTGTRRSAKTMLRALGRAAIRRHRSKR